MQTSIVHQAKGLLYKSRTRVHRAVGYRFLKASLGLLQQFCGTNKPVSLAVLTALRATAANTLGSHPLSKCLPDFVSTGRQLKNPFLSQQLADKEFGVYPLSAASLDFLEEQIHVHRPTAILEFGSGSSTVCLAHYMKELHGDKKQVYVISVEQDGDYAQQTRETLRQQTLDHNALVFHVPTKRQRIQTVETECYDIRRARELITTLETFRPNFVLIDGPSGGKYNRFGTLPLVQDFLGPNAIFFMDDAVRDWEMDVATHWKYLLDVNIEGVYLVGKGMLFGTVLTNE